MALQRVGTFKSGKRTEAVILVVDGQTLKIDHADLAPFKSAKEIEDALNNQATTGNVQPPKIFIHINRDGSLALATGTAPEIWPEDEEEIPGPGEWRND